MPDMETLLANLIKELAGKRPLIGIGFSAGAYCLTELLGHGQPSCSAIALGGLHGHGQPNMNGVPRRNEVRMFLNSLEIDWSVYEEIMPRQKLCERGEKA